MNDENLSFVSAIMFMKAMILASISCFLADFSKYQMKPSVGILSDLVHVFDFLCIHLEFYNLFLFLVQMLPVDCSGKTDTVSNFLLKS